ncbi:hypothetical protein RRG08_043272 [Elysia crispata]|uniref:Uncharacterized protein n=1 Tax=Elysia crispata TaxID=231223 RepID=A0AAE1CPH6_9GAST|nr:hypothetical protein RRG08_043272 [Elysia crispata]
MHRRRSELSLTDSPLTTQRATSDRIIYSPFRTGHRRRVIDLEGKSPHSLTTEGVGGWVGQAFINSHRDYPPCCDYVTPQARRRGVSKPSHDSCLKPGIRSSFSA